jgi:acetylornithine deacetylase
MAAMLTAFARVAAERPKNLPTLIMACTVNEEHGYSGASALVKLWSQPGSIFPRRPDGCVVAEPTSLQVVVAHKGVVRWRCHARGRATHSSQPHLGINAIFRMRPVLAALERYQKEIAPTLGEHPRCGRPTLSVGTITGGLSVNTVPDRCTIEIDRRLIPGEDPHSAYRQVIEFVTREVGAESGIEHDAPFLIGVGLKDDHNPAVAGAMAAAATDAGIACQSIGVPYGTDAAAYDAAGVPSVVFGPGSIDQAHTADEWVSLDELEQASEALYRFGRRGL